MLFSVEIHLASSFNHKKGGSQMNFYTKQHKFYCGIDLHTKKMYVCILDET